MNYFAVIVGAGPAGATAGMLLAKAGKSVLILDRTKVPVRKVCGEYLCPRGVQILNEIGAAESLTEAPPIFGMRMVSPRGTSVTSRFPGEIAGRAVNRKTFDAKLVELAMQAGAEIKWGANVEKIEETVQGWSIRTSNGDFEAAFVIGADGRQSKVSKLLENDLGTDSKRVAVHAYLQAASPNDRMGEMHMFEDGSYIGVDPTGEFEVNFSLVSDATKIQNLGGPGRAFFHYVNSSTDLQARFGVQLVNATLATTFPIQHRTKSMAPRPNVMLIGDAAGFVDPLTGEGMYNAILSAKLLCEALVLSPANAHQIYSRSYVKHLRSKTRLNRAFQALLRRPEWIERIARFLLRKPQRADTFIGIVGNVYTPFSGILRLMW